MTIQNNQGRYSSAYAASQIGRLVKEPEAVAYTQRLSESTQLPALMAVLISSFEDTSKRAVEVQLRDFELLNDLKQIIGSYSKEHMDRLKTEESTYFSKLQTAFAVGRLFAIELLPSQKRVKSALAALPRRLQAAIRFFAEKLANKEYENQSAIDPSRFELTNCYHRAVLFLSSPDQRGCMPNFDAISPIFFDRLVRYYLLRPELKESDIEVSVAGALPPPPGVLQAQGPPLFKAQIPQIDPLAS